MQGEDDSVHSDQKKSPNSLFISCESLSNMFVNMDLNINLFLSNTRHRFSKKQRHPAWLLSFESVKCSTNITASFVRRANYQIQASRPLMTEI